MKKVFNKLGPKIIDGQALNGQMFCNLAESYVQSINSDSIPTISSAWERVLDGELRRIYEQTITELDDFMKNTISKKFPLEETELKE